MYISKTDILKKTAIASTITACFISLSSVARCQENASTFSADPKDKKIIELGWDSLPVEKLVEELPSRQNSHFDGMGFLVPLQGDTDSSICLFDTTVHNDEDYRFDLLKRLSESWGKYTDNLIWVFAIHWKSNRAFDWFDDEQWQRIEANARNLSKCIKISGAKGIALDPEHYYGENPWQYSAEKFNGKSFDEVSKVVRARGAQYMRALQSEKQEVVLMAFELLFGSGRKIDEAWTLGLLGPFALGLLEGANPGSVLMDGAEVNYHLSSTAGASYYYNVIRRELRENRVPEDLKGKYDKQYLAAYGLCMDLCYVQGDLAVHTGLNQEQMDDFWRNNLYYSLRNTDRYVWVYSQYKTKLEERVNWYTGEFLPENASRIVKEVREKLDNGKALGFTLNTPFEKIMEPNVQWSPDNKNIISSGEEVQLYYDKDDQVSHVDLYLDGLRVGSFYDGKVIVSGKHLSPGKHQLVLRGFSRTEPERFNDSDIFCIDVKGL
jgi:hypothetical protein